MAKKFMSMSQVPPFPAYLVFFRVNVYDALRPTLPRRPRLLESCYFPHIDDFRQEVNLIYYLQIPFEKTRATYSDGWQNVPLPG